MADPTLDSYWGQFFATWDEWDNTINWLFPEGVSVAGVTIDVERIKALGRLSPNTHLSVAIAAAVKQGLGQDRVRALRDFAAVIDPLEWDAKRGGRGGGGAFGPAFVNALENPLPDLGALMAQTVITNGYRLTIRSSVGSQEVVNVMHFLGGGPGEEQTLAQAAVTAWGGAGRPFLAVGNSAVQLREIEATDLSSTSGGIWVETPTGIVGATQQLATAGAAALIQWNGQTRSRNSRGRLYLGPLRENQVETDGRTLATGVATTLTNAITGFRADLAALGFNLHVLSRATNTMFPVTLMRVAPIIATQRRRIRS